MSKYKEEVIGGNTNEIKMGEEVTWKARHVFKTRFLKTKITAFNRPESFSDEQVKGDFKKMKHDHFFKPIENGTIMIDLFEFIIPYGFLGKIFNHLYLTNYIRLMLEERNKTIKQAAEGNKWKQYLIK